MLLDTIDDLDQKLARAVSKQEHEYLEVYSRFVQDKTKQLNDLEQMLMDKAANTSIKDQQIGELQKVISSLRDDAARGENLNREKQDDLKKMKQKLEMIMADRKFLYKHAREEKQKSMQLQKDVEGLRRELQET